MFGSEYLPRWLLLEHRHTHKESKLEPQSCHMRRALDQTDHTTVVSHMFICVCMCVCVCVCVWGRKSAEPKLSLPSQCRG